MVTGEEVHTEAREAVEKPHNVLEPVIQNVQDIVDRGCKWEFRKQPVEFAAGARLSAALIAIGLLWRGIPEAFGIPPCTLNEHCFNFMCRKPIVIVGFCIKYIKES